MNVPGTVVGLKYLKIGSEYAEYCGALNEIVRDLSTTKGKRGVSGNFAGMTYTYRNQKVMLVYQDSDYGNDHYQIFVSNDVWNDLPNDINPMLISENGWNFVYHFQDSPDRKILHHHIPGTWINLFFQS